MSSPSRFYPDGGLNDETRARLGRGPVAGSRAQRAIHLATVKKNWNCFAGARNDGLSAMAQHATLSVVIARQKGSRHARPDDRLGVIRRLEDGPSIT